GQPGVRDRRVANVQLFQCGEWLHVLHPRVRDLVEEEQLKALEVLECLQLLQSVVGDLLVEWPEADRDDRLAGCLVVASHLPAGALGPVRGRALGFVRPRRDGAYQYDQAAQDCPHEMSLRM